MIVAAYTCTVSPFETTHTGVSRLRAPTIDDPPLAEDSTLLAA